MPWTIIMQEQAQFEATVEVEAKRVVIELPNKKKKAPTDDDTIQVMVGAAIYVRNDRWIGPVVMKRDDLQGALKLFYSTDHQTFSLQHPHRLEVCPKTGARKMQEVKTRTLGNKAIMRALAECNMPADFAEYIVATVKTVGTRKERAAA